MYYRRIPNLYVFCCFLFFIIINIAWSMIAIRDAQEANKAFTRITTDFMRHNICLHDLSLRREIYWVDNIIKSTGLRVERRGGS